MYLVVLVKASRLGTMICVQRQKAQRPHNDCTTARGYNPCPMQKKRSTKWHEAHEVSE